MFGPQDQDQPHQDDGVRRAAPGHDWGSSALDVIRKEVDIRLQAVTRLRHMNTQHAMHAWSNRYKDPISPYGLAFLYVQPSRAPHQRWHNMLAATKLWLDGPESKDLPRMLYNLNSYVVSQADVPGFDPRRDLANRFDSGMQDDAWFVGLGVSSLDTATGRWDVVRNKVERYGDVPGTVRIAMIDGTLVVCDRRGLPEFNALTLRSTQPLGASTIDTLYSWNSVTSAELRDDPDSGLILRWMEELTLNLWRADNARLAAAHPAPPQPPPPTQQPAHQQPPHQPPSNQPPSNQPPVVHRQQQPPNQPPVGHRQPPSTGEVLSAGEGARKGPGGYLPDRGTAGYWPGPGDAQQ